MRTSQAASQPWGATPSDSTAASGATTRTPAARVSRCLITASGDIPAGAYVVKMATPCPRLLEVVDVIAVDELGEASGALDPLDAGGVGAAVRASEALIRLPASVQYKVGLVPPVPVVTNMPVRAEKEGEPAGAVYCATNAQSCLEKATMRLFARS